MILADSEKYGPFASVVGLAGVIMASAGAIFLAWGGTMKAWRLPQTDLSGKERNIVLLLCGVFMVAEFVFVDPKRLLWYTIAAVVLAIFTAVFFIQYGSIINVYGYKKQEKNKKDQPVDVLILGGRKLKPEAAKRLKELQKESPGLDVQGLLEGSSGPGQLWPREELEWVRKRAVIYFILLLVVGTSALTIAGFATQMAVEKRAADAKAAQAKAK
jgi:hypothetical protein